MALTIGRDEVLADNNFLHALLAQQGILMFNLDLKSMDCMRAGLICS